MNFKDKITKKLLETGKKHRILVYPTLALVAVITAISHAVYWGRGNGKRFVASAMIMIMLFTQSLFLTSSANVETEEGQSGETTEVVVELPGESDEDTTEAVQIVSEETTTVDTSIDVISGDELNELNQTSQINDTTEASTEISTEAEEIIESDETTIAQVDPENINNTQIVIDNETTEETDDNQSELIDNTIDNLVVESNGVNGLNGEGEEGSGETSTENTSTEDPDEGENTSNYSIRFFRVDNTGGEYTIVIPSDYDFGGRETISGTDVHVTFNMPTADEVLGWYAASRKESKDNFSCEAIYTGSGDLVSQDATSITVKKTENNVYTFYIKITRKQYDVIINLGDRYVYDKAQVKTEGLAIGNITPDATYVVKPAAHSIYYVDDSLPGAYAWGKNYSGVSYGKSAYSPNGEIPIIGSEVHHDSTAIQMTATWENQTFDVNYIFVGEEDDDYIEIDPSVTVDPTKKYVYGDTDMNLITSTELTTTNGGYILGGWTDGTTTYKADGQKYDSSQFAVNMTQDDSGNPVITKNPNVTGVTLTAVWEYKGNTLVVSGEKVSATEDVVTIDATYGDYIECTISAKYLKDGSPNFVFEMDPALRTSFQDNYGLNISANTSQDGKVTSYSISGTITGVTGENGATVAFNLKDEKKIGNQNFPKSIVLKAAKKQVTIDATSIKHENGKDSVPSKAYDGEAKINVFPKADVKEIVLNDNVYVSFEAIADLDNKNAGNKKQITIKKVVLEGSDAENYELIGLDTGTTNATIPGIATVHRIPVEVESVLVEGASDTILFGQLTPQYKVKLTDASAAALVGSDKSTYESDVDSFMVNSVGFSGWSTNRSLYSPAGKYSITPVFKSDNANYTVSASSGTAEFTVGRDLGEGHYTLSPETPVAGDYYKDLTVVPAGGYDLVRIVEDGKDIAVGADYDAVRGLFSTTVTYSKDMTNDTIQFQMMDSKSGAITTIETLGNINIDSHGPVLTGYDISINKDYFREFGFGSYYHAQDIDGKYVESVDITFTYTCDHSKCDKLVYYFTDENGNVKGNYYGEVDLIKNAGGNDYSATVNIGTGRSGQLIVYAVDEATNESDKSKVKLYEVFSLVSEGDQKPENYYEWMVENIIDSADISTTDGNGNTLTSGVWYNQLNFDVVAADEDSGVHSLTWKITKPDGTIVDLEENAHNSVELVLKQEKEGKATEYGKLTAYTFSTDIAGEDAQVGEYYVGAVLYDNAGNNKTLNEKGPFLFDGKKPEITCDDYEIGTEEYLSGVTFEFTVTEGDNESGIASVQLYHIVDEEKTLLNSWGNEGTYSVDIVDNGTYLVVATDIAGNVSEKEVTFSGISTVAPSTPVISVEGTQGNDGWYIGEMPTVIIDAEDVTVDGVPVSSTYKLTIGGNQIQANLENTQERIVMTNEGEILVEAWSKSKAGCLSETASEIVKIDINSPEITITDSLVDESGNTLIKFTVTDNVSGVDVDEVYVNGEAIKVAEENGVVTGSFVADNNQTYSIVAKDIAGNESDATEFAPLKLQVSPVINITPNGAYIDAKVIEGTYPISDCYIAYKKASDNDYDTALSNKHKQDYGVSMDYTFRNLTPNTVYDYRVYAIASNSNEVQVIEGSFRTADINSTATVYGSVKYADDLAEAYKTYPLYVALYDANTVIAGVQLEKPEDTEYIFKNVADGNYRIVASNGMLSEVSTVTVTNGGISYPKDYATKGGVHFILDGLSTDVVVEDNSINITADGLEKIYNTALYNGNVTDEDLEVVEAGGTVDITLYASYMNVSSVDKNTESIFANKIGKNGIIERYISLYVVKEVRDVDGKLVNGTPTNITRLAEPVTISFPLGELSGQKIYVASVHQNGDNYTYVNWAGSDVTLSQNFVTISTDRFSVYALYRIIETKKEYTVKWIDGDGNIMKTETVVEGEKATPPTETPKKSETDKYTYVFSGWDTDYSKISKDTVISAWFVAKEKEVKPPATEAPTTETPNTTETPVDKPSNTTEASKDDADKEDITKEPTNYPYMGSGISPQTGDAAPIVAIMALMLISGAGLVIVNKRRKED